jgi:hypothetical protein
VGKQRLPWTVVTIYTEKSRIENLLADEQENSAGLKASEY